MADDKEKKKGYFIQYPVVVPDNDNYKKSSEFIYLDNFIEIDENNFLHAKRKTKNGRTEETTINLNQCLFYKLYRD